MSVEEAITIWRYACKSQAFEAVTEFNYNVCNMNPMLAILPEERKYIAEFLREWANAIELPRKGDEKILL